MTQTNPKTARRLVIGLFLGILIPAMQFIVLDDEHADNLNRLKNLEVSIFQTWTAQEDQKAIDPTTAPSIKDPVRKEPVRFAANLATDTDPVWATTTY